MFEHKGIKYRVGTKADSVGLALFFSKVPAQNNFHELLDYDVTRVNDVIKEIIEDNRGAILLATYLDKSIGCDIIVGAMVLGDTTLWWSSKKFFTNVAFYVNPKYRRKYDIQRTILWFSKKFSKDTDTPIILSIFSKNKNNNTLKRYFSINGFEETGFQMIYDPKETNKNE